MAPSADRRACDECAANLAEVELAAAVRTQIDALPVISLGSYDGWLQSLILKHKRAPSKPLSRELARLLAEKTPETWRGLPVIWVPGPLYGDIHLVERLALELGRFGQRLANTSLLTRRINRPTTPQKALGESKRRHREIEKLYRTRKKGTLFLSLEKNREVILLDDVVTTGSTLLGCKQLLEEHLGLKVQGALSIAYTPRRFEN